MNRNLDLNTNTNKNTNRNLRRSRREVKGRARSANDKLDPYNWDGSSPAIESL